jgi:hypothetical protein
MKKTLEDLQIRYDDPITINCDNTSAINISKNPVMHSKTKHIPIKYHFLRDRVTQRVVKVEYVGTKEQIADIFTKCWTQWYDIVIDVNRVQVMRSKLRRDSTVEITQEKSEPLIESN